MKREHEVTSIQYSNFTPHQVAEWLMTTAWDKPYLHASKQKCPTVVSHNSIRSPNGLRITIRVERVDAGEEGRGER